MAVKWTPAQKEAVDADVSNILVTAAAGSGKTQVLTGRIIRRILGGEADINRLLIMTFTRAAASQMRERIGNALKAELERDSENKNIRRQLSLLSCAKITTIDAFCMDVVKSNFFAANLKPDFKIADADELEILTEEAANEVVEQLYEEGDEDFLNLTNCYSDKKGDAAVIKMAVSLLDFAQSMPYPRKWIDSVCGQYNILAPAEYLRLPCAEYAFSCALSKIRAAHDIITHAKGLCCEENGLSKYIELFADDLIFLESVISASKNDDIKAAWDSVYTLLLSFAPRSRPAVKGADESIKEIVSKIRDTAKAYIVSARELLCAPWSECAKMHMAAYPLIRAIQNLAYKIEDRLNEKKAERSVLSFSDVSHKCIELLGGNSGTPTPIADTIMQRYDEIYIDEYQDSNAMQELIFNLISRERLGTPNIFMVGDMKQSIYAFRQTSPELFTQKSLTYKTGEDERYRKIQLAKNFRSRDTILEFVNSLFSKVMSEEFGGVDYTGGERLVCGASFPAPPKEFKTVDFCLTDTGALDIPEDEESPKKSELEARLIAKKIHSLIESNTPVYNPKDGTQRPIKYSDIVILLRSAKTAAPIFAQELQKANIPVFSEVGDSFFASAEVTTFLSLLSVIDNPLSDIPLLAVMRSPIFSFDENDLAKIRLVSRRGSFFAATEKAALGEDALAAKCKSFLSRLSAWRKKAKHMPLGEFIWFLFEETGYMDFVSALPQGDIRAANLRMLFDKANAYEKTSFKGLFNFIVFIEKLSAKSSQPEAKTIDESHNVVRIMTIHKSKGLEFPVVFLSNTSAKFNKSSSSGNLLFHKNLGLGLRAVDPDLGICYNLHSKTAIAQRINDDEMNEEVRVLYVALTRATEKLIITGALDIFSAAKSFSFLAAAPSARNFLSARSSLEIMWSTFLSQGAMQENISLNIQSEYIPAGDSSPSENDFSGIGLPCSDDTASRLAYKYPFGDLSTIPTKVSVTELKRLLNDDDGCVNLYTSPRLHTPQFSFDEQYIPAAERGTIIHFVMQLIDFKKTESMEDIEHFLSSLVSRHILTEQMKEVVPAEKIYAFLHSSIGRRIKNADRCEREVPFTMPIPASLLTGRAEHFGETVILQGIIDCFFFEGDEIILLDYKSDNVKNTEEIKEKYRIQMDFYALALEKKFFRKIHEKCIYLFDNNGIIEL